MVSTKKLQEYLNTFLQSASINDYCPNGLQIQGCDEVKRLATAVSASLATIEAAIQWKADALLVHHGIFWNGDSYVITGVKQEKIKLLLANNINLLAYHLPLDVNQSVGNNWRAALEMGWTDLQPFGLSKGTAIGVKGKVGAIHRNEFKRKLEKYYDHAAECAFGGSENINTVALISGGAYRQINDAIAEGIDAFVTGNFDEPAWHLAMEGKINFFALGHSATERVGPRALGEHIKEQFAIEHQFIDIHNPF